MLKHTTYKHVLIATENKIHFEGLGIVRFVFGRTQAQFSVLRLDILTEVLTVTSVPPLEFRCSTLKWAMIDHLHSHS
jgi:hypothetical protein